MSYQVGLSQSRYRRVMVLGCNVLMRAGVQCSLDLSLRLALRMLQLLAGFFAKFDVGRMSALWAKRKRRDGGNDVNDPTETSRGIGNKIVCACLGLDGSFLFTRRKHINIAFA